MTLAGAHVGCREPEPTESPTPEPVCDVDAEIQSWAEVLQPIYQRVASMSSARALVPEGEDAAAIERERARIAETIARCDSAKLLATYCSVFRPVGLDTEHADLALRTIPPSDPAWVGNGRGLVAAARSASSRERASEYLTRVLAEHTDVGVRADVLAGQLEDAIEAGDDDGKEAAARSLFSDEMRGTAAAKRWRAYDPAGPLAVGRSFPELTYTKLDGSPGALQLDVGPPTLVVFWATWCAPCIAELPHLATLAQTHAGRLRVVSVLLDPDLEAARGIISEHDATWTQLATAVSNRAALGNPSLPTMVMVDADGVILARTPELTLEDVAARVGSG
jgi:thiol-disulfide isomerase/thioredoxin